MREPALRVYIAASVLAGVLAFCLSSIWLLPLAAGVSACIAAAFALQGVFSISNLGEAVIVTLGVAFLFCLMPKSFWLVEVAMPVGVGISIGKLCVGVWKELQS